MKMRNHGSDTLRDELSEMAAEVGLDRAKVETEVGSPEEQLPCVAGEQT